MEYIAEDVYEWIDNAAKNRARIAIDEELELEFQRTEYQRLRAPEYPSITDQLDMIWHAIDTGTLDNTSAFYTKLKEIKDKYPKL